MEPEASSPMSDPVSDLCESGSAADSHSLSELEFESGAAPGDGEAPADDVGEGDQTLADVCSRDSWILPGTLLSIQCKALLVKAYTALKAWPSKLKSEILGHWNIHQLPKKTNKAVGILMVLFGAGRKRISDLLDNKQNYSLHCPRDVALEEHTWAPKAPSQKGLEYLVELACACACEG